VRLDPLRRAADPQVPDEAPAEAAALFTALISREPAERPSALQVIERLEDLQPGVTRNCSLPISAVSSMPDSLPSAGARAGALERRGSHRRTASG